MSLQVPSVAIDLSAKLFPAATYSAECRDTARGGQKRVIQQRGEGGGVNGAGTVEVPVAAQHFTHH